MNTPLWPTCFKENESPASARRRKEYEDDKEDEVIGTEEGGDNAFVGAAQNRGGFRCSRHCKTEL